MKVGLIRRGYSPTGGAEKYLLRLVKGLEEAGHSCGLITDESWPEAAWGDRESLVLGKGLGPSAFAEAVKSRRRELACDRLLSLERAPSCDVYRAGDGVHAAWLDRRAVGEPSWKSAWRRRRKKHQELLALEAELYHPSFQGHLIVNSDLVAREMVRYYQTPESRIHCVVNGYDAPGRTGGERENLRARWRAEWKMQDGELAVLFVGSGWERKGLKAAAVAVAEANRQSSSDRSFRLLVAGTGKRPRDLPQEGITFLGGGHNLSELYEAADLFLLPTLYDPFSNATLEAAAHGLPVLTTTANGFHEIMSEGAEGGEEAAVAGRGTIVEPGDEVALVRALGDWAEPDRATEARDAIRSWASSYSVARNVEATLEVITSES